MHLHAENPTARQALDIRLPTHRGLYYGGDWHESAGGRQEIEDSSRFICMGPLREG